MNTASSEGKGIGRPSNSVGKLLFLTPVFPLPLYAGQQQRVINLLQCCTREFDVTFVAPKPKEAVDETQIRSMCDRVILFDADAEATNRWADEFRLRCRFGFLQSREKLRALSACAAQLRTIRLEEYALIWLERTLLAPLVRARRSNTVLDLDDLEHVKYAQEIRTARGGAQALKKLPYLARYVYREAFMSRQFNTVVVCSPEDRNYLQRLGVANVRVVPNGTNFISTAKRVQGTERFRLVFVGNMGYEPNLDAVTFLAESILPHVRKHIPDVEVDVIGKPPEGGAGLQGHVNFRGFIDDLSSCLSQYNVFVAPLRIGSGTKLKIVEAMGIGIPIVTTTVGARGLGLQHRHSAMIADTASGLAGAILDCYNNSILANEIASNALVVAKQFRWDSIQRSTATWLRQLAEEHEEFKTTYRH